MHKHLKSQTTVRIGLKMNNRKGGRQRAKEPSVRSWHT